MQLGLEEVLDVRESFKGRQVEEAMPNIHLKHEAEMRGKRDDLVHTKPEQPSDGTAGKDIVESVASGDGSLLAAKELAPRFGGDIGASELVEVDVPVSSRDPIGDVLDKGEELCQDGGVGLRVQARARLQVYRDDNKSPLDPGELDC